MALLAVHPSYQRQGVGSLLLTEGLKIVDEGGAKAFVQASREGRGLYTKFGWKAVGEVMVDYTPYGGEKVKTLLMIREPR